MIAARPDTPARLLRLQADERLASMLSPPGTSDAGRIEIPTREPVTKGDVIHIEVSFGAHADEVVLRGLVHGWRERGERAPLVTIVFGAEERSRASYVHDVLHQRRSAAARSSRRLDSEIQAVWRWGLGTHQTQIGDLSRGGAFIRTGAPPSVGSDIGLELDDSVVGFMHTTPLTLKATVAWVGRSRGHRGFGVKFRIGDRETSARIAALLRWHERDEG
ncbi:hypothetical protein PPSIR1_28418 [Plesiocystis pacifica SIR-1]|uniref:PilZ domain-containing protein n=1 Tax=Plesiocystis pacifica SIR-1 TaxID=391625 RepID=A6FZV6_9BACT|nr:PilZ domain-containing protein [Plesiocystis pacifica]EDM80912.1 hypothetical protein PPSIR1_28418 [Plesiocystis pacifica SIR-1]